MKILRAYKTELKLNNKQRSYLIQCAGVSRFVYNWALNDRIERYKRDKNTNMFEQKRRFNALKRDEYPWVYDVPYTIQEEVFRNLDNAYRNFFRRVKSGEKKKLGFPKFKNRKHGLGNFSLRGSIYIEKTRIKLPKMAWIRLKEKNYLPITDVKILKVTVSERASRWFASVQVETNISDPFPKNGKSLGIDVGIKNLAVLSNGKSFENPRALAKCEQKIKRLQKELHRRKKGSSNRRKTKMKLAKAYAKLANIRKHQLYEISSYVLKTKPAVIVLEDLNISGMMKNHHIAKALGDASMSELDRQIEYKCGWEKIEVKRVDRWYPSSKICSECGSQKDMKLSDRTYICDACGLKIDRDLNAARNLAAFGEPANGRGLSVESGCINAPLRSRK